MELIEIIIVIVGVVLGLAVGFGLGIGYRKKVAEREIGSAETTSHLANLAPLCRVVRASA